jgi:hypothetical protein
MSHEHDHRSNKACLHIYCIIIHLHSIFGISVPFPVEVMCKVTTSNSGGRKLHKVYIYMHNYVYN